MTVRSKPLLFIDSHPAHVCAESMHELEKNFYCLTNIPYTCELNSIETLWSVAKCNFAKKMI